MSETEVTTQTVEAESAPWQSQEGVVVAPALEPDKVCQALSKAGVIAKVDWYKDTPHLLGLNVLLDANGKVAVLNNADQVVAGPLVDELVELLAFMFKADVSIGEKSVDLVPENAQFPKVEKHGQEVRVVEVTKMPMASVPFCAAVEGTDMVAVELDDDFRAVMYTSDSDDVTEGAMVTETPGLALYSDGGDLRLAGVDRENNPVRHAAGLILHSWSMETRDVYGTKTDISPTLKTEIDHLFGEDDTASRLCEFVPRADQELVEKALGQKGEEGVRTMVQALGLPEDIVSFLQGKIAAEDVKGAINHESRGWANAIGRSVDIMLTEPESTGNQIWSTYWKVAVERPWIIQTLASIEASLGATLLAVSFRKRSESVWRKLGIGFGLIMVFDAIAEVTLAKYLGMREVRHRERLAEGNQK